MVQQVSIPHFAAQSRTVLSGSEKNPVSQPGSQKPATPTEQLTVSVIVRRKTPLAPGHAGGKQRITRTRFNAQHAADPAAVALVKRFAKEFGLKVKAGTPGPGRRTIKLNGTVAQMQRAFGVSLSHREIDGQVYRVRDGNIYVPAELQGYVVAVLGLDNRPQARPHFRILGEQGSAAPEAAGRPGFARPHATNGSFTPVQVGQLYQFPQGITASSQTIGIIELGGGFRQADITAYFKSLGLKAPKVVAVPIEDGKNNPGGPNGADGEVMLDIEVAGAVAPGARIVVYFAPNTDQGFVDAIATAVHDNKYKPSVISISWGAPEIQWTAQSMTALDAACQSAAALGITITVAAGDNGSSDGVNDKANHVDFPASSPHVLACGGTNLRGSGSTITAEVVWNDQAQGDGATGGGVSNVFPLPPWQAGANVPPPTSAHGGRGVPDVAGDADPATGYSILVDGKNMVIGGTSAVAPLWAGLIAVANQQNGTPAGFIQPAIYAAKNRNAFLDITTGNNGAFKAGPGWDACTGLGSPIAPRLINAIRSASTASELKVAATKAKAPVRRSHRKRSAKSK
jgi:kumamolisin